MNLDDLKAASALDSQGMAAHTDGLPQQLDAAWQLAQLATEARTVVVFEAPHRLLATLQDIAQLFGERPLAVARELTKLHEEIVRGTAQTAHAHFLESEPRGEVTLVIGGSPAAAEWALARVQAALQEALQSGLSAATAAKQVAADSGWTRRALYQLLERK